MVMRSPHGGLQSAQVRAALYYARKRRLRRLSGVSSVGITAIITGLDGSIARVGAHGSIGYTIDPDNGTETVKWSSSSNPADAATYGTGASPTDYTAGDAGTLYLHVTDDSETVTRAAPIRREPAVNTVAPVASGDTSLGDVLSVTNGTWTGAVGGSYTYQWQRGGVDISGATASSYMIVEADDAADLTCDVTYTNSGGAITATSNAITVDDFAVPVITGVPTISGTEQVGSTLTATPASVAGNPTPTRTWQWFNSVSGAISGATSSTYVLQASDEGDTITVQQIETNGLGVDTATSAATGAIAAPPDFSFVETAEGTFEVDGATGEVTVTVTSPAVYANYDAGNGAGIFIFNQSDLATSPVAIVPPQIIDDGTPADGETLTLTPGLWVYDPDNGGIGTPTYQWQSDVGGNGTFSNISGATSSTYTLTAGEGGDDVRVIESLADNAGTGTSTSAAVSVAGGVVTTLTRLDNGTQIENRAENAQTYTPGIQYTVPAGSDRLMIAAVSWRNAGSASIAPTLAFGGVAMTLEGVSSTAAPQLPASAIFTMREADIPAGAQSFDIDFGLFVNGLTLHVLTYGGVDQTTPAGAMTAGTLGAVSTSYNVGVTVSANSALVAVGASLEDAGQRPTTVSGDATEQLESLSPGNSRVMLVLATGENTTAGAKTVIFTPDVDGQQAIAAAIEVFGS